MRFSTRHSLVPFAAGTLLLLAAPLSSQALLVYAAGGPSISGSLAGMAFTAAPWSLTATADGRLATQRTFTVSGQGTFDLWSLPVSPKVQIQTMASVLQADLLPEGRFAWLVLSGTFPVGATPKIGFVYTTPSFNPETAAGVYGVEGSFVNLQSPVSFTGPSIFESNSFASNVGPLVISASSRDPGTFRIDPAPAPLPALAVAGAFSWSRKLRRRLARRAG